VNSGLSDERLAQVRNAFMPRGRDRGLDREELATIRARTPTFFDVYLKGAPASELKNVSEYPEVEFVP
jgi:hypothetical protein